MSVSRPRSRSACARRRGCARGSSRRRPPGGAGRSPPARRAWWAAAEQSALAVSAPVGATVNALVMGVMLSDRLPHLGSPGARSDPASPVGLREGRRGRRGLRRAGLVVLLGVTHDDGREQVDWMARKIWGLRILRDEQSASDIGGRRSSWSASSRWPTRARAGQPGTRQLRGRCRSRSTVGVLGARGARRQGVARPVRSGHAGPVGQRRAGDLVLDTDG